MAFVDVGVGFVRSLVVWLEANRAPAPTALWSLYLRLKAAPKSVTPIAITISKGNATANSRISDPSVPAHASSHLRQTVLTESVTPFLLRYYVGFCLLRYAIIVLAELEQEICLLPRSQHRGCWDHNRRHSTLQRICLPQRRTGSQVAKNPQSATEQSH